MQLSQTPSGATPALARTRSGAPVRAIFALALALLTRLTLGQLSLLGGRVIEKSPGVSTRTTRAGADFYDAIGAYLATGEAGRLRALIHPDFVDHAAGAPAAPGSETFLRQLDTLRAFAAGRRLVATPLSSSGDVVQFAVSIPPAGDAQVLGLPFARTGLSAASETLRIVDGRVAERWSNLQLPVASTSLASITWDPPAASQMLPAIERLTMLRGSKMTLKVGTAHVIVVESGALTIEGTPHGTASSNPIAASASVQSVGAAPLVALPGSAVFKASSSPYRIINDGPQVASALLIRTAGYALPPDLPAFWAFGTSQNDVGVQIDPLSAAVAPAHRQGAWNIEIGRATLSAGTAIPQHEVNGSELIYVEQGTLETDLDACAERCVHTVAGAGAFVNEPDLLQAEHGISASDGATTAYRVSGSAPATLLIVTVRPASG